MECRLDVERFVVIVCTRHREKPRPRVCADRGQEVPNARPSETANNVPTFDADVASVLDDLGQSADLIQRVRTWPRNGAPNLQRPGSEVNLRLEDVVCVIWESV